jgi:hypothetical protein
VGLPIGLEKDVSDEYSFRVTGRLTATVLRALEPLTASPAATDTVLVGRVVDRSELHGFIARIEALGLELVEMRRLPARRAAVARCPECGGGVGGRAAPVAEVGPRT